MPRFPLVDIVSAGGEPVAVEPMPTGWRLATAGGMRARVRGFRDGLIGRAAAGEDTEVVQLGIGAATSALCNTLYSPAEDLALVFAGDALRLEARPKGGFQISAAGPVTITAIANYMKVHRGVTCFRPLDRGVFKRPFAGWCSWYCYHTHIGEGEWMKNVDWLAENLKPFGLTLMQIDDGWQNLGLSTGRNRNWFEPCARLFPHGMRPTTDYARSKGLVPGVWVMPFAQSDTELWAKQPRLFLHREDGTSVGERTEPLKADWMPADDRWYDWTGRYYIDPTGEEGQAYLRRLFHTLCDEYGYGFVKIDAQSNMPPLFAAHRSRMCRPEMDAMSAYRYGLQAMKEAMGPGNYLLNCFKMVESCGICDGLRTGLDAWPADWKGFQIALEATLRWLFLNTLGIYTDPDIVRVSEETPLEMARLWAAFVGLTGQQTFCGDKMFELPAERLDLIKRILPVADIHPMELYPLDTHNRPGVWDVKVALPGVGEWDVVGLFNWQEDAARTFALTPQKLGLPTGEWLVLDGATGMLLHRGDGACSVEVPPLACRLVSYWRAADRPQFVGTNRHLTQGAVDVEKVTWNERNLTLSGTSQVVAGDPYRVRIHVPTEYHVAPRRVRVEGEMAELTIRPKVTGRLRWRVRFEKA